MPELIAGAQMDGRMPQFGQDRRMVQGRSMRADGLRSRAAIVIAATEVFAQEGVDASLERIARVAGVGSATLHRHFTTRHALLTAVVSSAVDGFVGEARTQLAIAPQGQALWRWLEVVVGQCAVDRAIVNVLVRQRRDDGEELWSPLVDAGGPLLEAARKARTVDPEVSVLDLLRLVNAIASAAAGGPADARRLLRLSRRGLGNP